MASAALDKEIDIVGETSPHSASETSSQLDDTYETYKKSRGAVVDPAEAKRVLRKIDYRVVPILFFIYLLQYLDKNGINYASAFGLAEGTNLHGQDYSWLGEWKNTRIGSKLSDCLSRINILFWVPGWTVSLWVPTSKITDSQIPGFCDIGLEASDLFYYGMLMSVQAGASSS